MASVITTAGTPKTAMPTPLQRPTSAPMPSVTRRANGIRASLLAAVLIIRMAPALSVHGTDRSIPPIRMTKVWPAATRPTKQATVSTAAIPLGLEKPGRISPPMKKRRIAATIA